MIAMTFLQKSAHTHRVLPIISEFLKLCSVHWEAFLVVVVMGLLDKNAVLFGSTPHLLYQNFWW